jgi:hypothetical protein
MRNKRVRVEELENNTNNYITKVRDSIIVNKT